MLGCLGRMEEELGAPWKVQLECTLSGCIVYVCAKVGAAEMVQQLRALAALAKDPGSIHSTHRCLTTVWNSRSRESDAFSLPQAHMWCTYIMQAKCLIK